MALTCDIESSPSFHERQLTGKVTVAVISAEVSREYKIANGKNKPRRNWLKRGQVLILFMDRCT